MALRRPVSPALTAVAKMSKAMVNRNHFFSLTVFVLFLNLATGVNAQPAQPDPSFDDIPLNGLASFVQLRKEYYIGGLYLESLSQEDSGAIFSFSGRKRMEMRITIDKWSPRRFAQQWNQAILINNDQELQAKYADEILKFGDMMKDDLVAGDRITIDMDSNGTIVYINSNRMFGVKDKEFFDVLLNTWIGPRPPSSEFKNNILTLPTDAAGTALLARYEATIPTKARTQLVAKWSTDPGKRKVVAAAAPVEAAKNVEPDAVTQVKARRSGSTSSSADTASSSAKAPVATQAPAMAAPKPKLEVAKPTIAKPAAPKPAPKPEPKQVAKAEPKPAPKPAPAPAPKKEEPKPAPKQVAKAEPKPAAPVESAEDKEQARLMRMYRSNVLKLTYLNTQYPKKAMDFKQEGLVVLKVTINRKGDIDNIEEATASEHQLLNKAARRAVQKSEPYPEIPTALKGETVVVTLPFNFRL